MAEGEDGAAMVPDSEMAQLTASDSGDRHRRRVSQVAFPTIDTVDTHYTHYSLQTPNMLPVHEPGTPHDTPEASPTSRPDSEALLSTVAEPIDDPVAAHTIEQPPESPLQPAVAPKRMPGSIRFPSKPGNPNKLAIIMVGLPLRGKTFVSLRISRYLVWLGHKSRVFVVNDYRRQLMQEYNHEYSRNFYASERGRELREEAAKLAVDEMVGWLNSTGQVAILDDLNVTRAGRRQVMKRFHDQEFQVVFVECQSTKLDEIENKYRQFKETSPDYEDLSDEEAMRDLDTRSKHYESIYEPLDEADEDTSYIRVVDGSRQMVVNKFGGHLPGRIVALLMNVHSEPRHIYLSRHGLSEFNLEDRIGGDSNITPQGIRYAKALAKYIKGEIGGSRGQLAVWTSTLERTKQTVQFIKRHKIEWRALDEIHAGICDSLTQEEIESKHPTILEARKRDKLTFRYPEGESYLDVIRRLEPIFIGMERQRCPLLVVAHQAVLRVLMCYLTDVSPAECPHYPIPMHSVLKLTPHAYGTHVELVDLKAESEGQSLDRVSSH